ncbi:hypothetical protein GCM10023185_14660 [Hymenobacter saemangeumensis]|uniref:Uncharacterized protein n=1 Tax=Hymenobacter saemangeumensis TaxID=1084522 RepID=A0ABP8I8Q8_9BACT
MLTCDVVLPRSQRPEKQYGTALTLPAVLDSAGQYDTDAVELAPGMIWRTCIFRLYQWRKDALGVSAEPYEVARFSFLPSDWQTPLSLCRQLVSELNNGQLSDTARQIKTICNS